MGNNLDAVTKIQTSIGTLVARGYNDSKYPSISVELLLPDGNTVLLTVIELLDDAGAEEQPELRTLVYGEEGDDCPTEVLTHKLLTEEERKLVFA